jgi:hypothetical protein
MVVNLNRFASLLAIVTVAPAHFSSAQDTVTIPDGIAGAPGTGQNRGLRVISVQAPDSSEVPNSYLRANQQLNGTLRVGGDLVADEAGKGGNADGSFDVEVINFEKDANPEVGDLTRFPGDELFPGIPGTGGHTNLFATEVTGYLELSAGEHTLGTQVIVGRVDEPNDNGLRIFTGTNPRDFFATELANFVRPAEAPPFASTPWDYEFTITAPEDGIYPIRLVFWSQNGAAALEFYQDDQLINAAEGDISAYRESTTAFHNHAYIADISPFPGVSDIAPEEPIEILLRDDKTSVAPESIKFSFNQVDVTSQAMVVTADGRTTITYQPPVGRQSERNEIAIEYADSAGQSFSREWSFQNTLGEKPPKVTAQWDFSDGLKATFGDDLQYNDMESMTGTMFGTTTSFGIADIGGETADVMFVPEGSQVGYLAKHGIAPNGGGLYVNRYTLLMDVMRVGSGGASAIIQASPTKNPGDATFFSQNSNMGQGGGGYAGDGSFTSDEWHRIGFSVDLSSGSGVITKWVDGILQDEWTPQGKDHIRRSMEPEIIFFYDVDERSSWYVNSIQFLDGMLSNDEMAALGGPTAEGFESPNATGLIITDIVVGENGGVTITWNSRPGRSYAVDAAEKLGEFFELTDSHPSQGESTQFTESAAGAGENTRRFYRVREE